MRILQLHNFYQQPGGEDVVAANEEALLIRRGHQVWRFNLHNDLIQQMATFQVALKTLWNADAYRMVRQKIQQHGIDIVHAHNTFPLMSPAVYHAAQAENVPVIQTLHNYRLLCPAATFYRAGKACQICSGSTVPWPAVVHRCYRNSLAASGVAATMLAAHRLGKTYSTAISAYIAPSKFALETFVQGGLPRVQLHLKPNFLLDDPGIGSGMGGYALYLGRLAPEKGVETMLKAWTALSSPIPLKIAGDGPLRGRVESASRTIRGVEYLGHCPRARAIDLLSHASLLIFPSEWFEVSPLSVIEAMACGTPVLASDHGTLKEMIIPEKNGFFFPVGNAPALASSVDSIFRCRGMLNELRFSARRQFEAHYTASVNYRQLLDIYSTVSAPTSVQQGAD